jgi:hypothetical protein
MSLPVQWNYWPQRSVHSTDGPAAAMLAPGVPGRARRPRRSGHVWGRPDHKAVAREMLSRVRVRQGLGSEAIDLLVARLTNRRCGRGQAVRTTRAEPRPGPSEAGTHPRGNPAGRLTGLGG